MSDTINAIRAGDTIESIEIDIECPIRANDLKISQVDVEFVEKEDSITSIQVDIGSAVKFIPISSEYIKIMNEDSDSWQQIGNVYKIFIPIEEHKIKNVKGIEVLLKHDVGGYFENIVYTYKIYYSGKVAVILDKKINCKIIIKGES